MRLRNKVGNADSNIIAVLFKIYVYLSAFGSEFESVRKEICPDNHKHFGVTADINIFFNICIDFKIFNIPFAFKCNKAFAEGFTDIAFSERRSDFLRFKLVELQNVGYQFGKMLCYTVD